MESQSQSVRLLCAVGAKYLGNSMFIATWFPTVLIKKGTNWYKLWQTTENRFFTSL